MKKLEKQLCPFCNKKALTLSEKEEISNGKRLYVLSMKCSNCDYEQEDIELEEKNSSKIEVEVNNKKDMNIKLAVSGDAVVKIPQLRMKLEGIKNRITTIEDLLTHFKKNVEEERDSSEDKDVKKKAKNLLKKIWKIECGDIPIKVIIEDKSGNSTILK